MQNIVIVLRILLTIPVTTDSAEHSFLNLKPVKIYLGSNILDEPPTVLTLISNENYLGNSIKFSELIDNFVLKKQEKLFYDA